jgi:hypothetical protein
MDAVFERRIIMENNPANELNESLKTIFSFPTTNNEKTDEAIHAFASTANLLAQMVVRTGARYQEGSEAIKYLGLAFLHYRIGMERRPPDEKKEE